jgi:hypothetical protein
MTPGEVRSSDASDGKRKRVSCKYKQELFVTLGVAKPVHGVWTCSFCLSFGREQRTPPASFEDDNDGKRRRKPIRNPWSTSDFSRAHIEEHYEHSHPRMWGKFKEGVASAYVMSAAAVRQFFNMNKLEAHFRRAPAGSFKITVSSAVGKLILFLCEKDNDSDLATGNDVRFITVLRRTPPADGDDIDSSDSVHNPTAAEGFTAELHCWRTFMYCDSLIPFGLSYRQIASVMETMRCSLPGGRSEFIPVTRQTASIYSRFVVARALEALWNVLRRSWAFAIAADGSAHAHGVAYFSFRLRLISIESKTRKSTLHNVHLVAPPMAASHTGQNMFEMTSCALDALDSEWRSKLIGCTSDGAANMTGVHSGWQSLI